MAKTAKVSKKPHERDKTHTVRCGNCTGYHKSASKVRDCYLKSGKVKKALKNGPKPEAPVVPEVTFYGRGGKALPFPPGRYAIKTTDKGHPGIVVKFYKVEQPDEGKWKGYVFVAIQASDEFFPIRDRNLAREVIDAIAENPRKAMLRYGKELGICGVCGRTLTNNESRRRGIGPVCAATTTF